MLDELVKLVGKVEKAFGPDFVDADKKVGLVVVGGGGRHGYVCIVVMITCVIGSFT